MKLKLFTLTLLIIINWYLGFSLFNGGEFNPIEWNKGSKEFFIWIIFGCLLAYGVFTAEPPRYNK